MTPHMARHIFAKNLVNSGVSLEKVAMLLGHSSLDTTMVYTTPGFSDLDQAVRVLDM
jgi:site-specific recombinase XerD